MSFLPIFLFAALGLGLASNSKPTKPRNRFVLPNFAEAKDLGLSAKVPEGFLLDGQVIFLVANTSTADYGRLVELVETAAKQRTDIVYMITKPSVVNRLLKPYGGEFIPETGGVYVAMGESFGTVSETTDLEVYPGEGPDLFQEVEQALARLSASIPMQMVTISEGPAMQVSMGREAPSMGDLIAGVI